MPDRIEVISFACSFEGISANPKDPETRAIYLGLIAQGETPERAAEMAIMSGCALTQRGILFAWIDHPLLNNRYRDRMAMADLGDIAREADAIRLPSHDRLAGDLVIVGGEDPKLGGPEHVWMDLGDGTGLDGGQRDLQHFECIRIRNHETIGGWDHGHDSNDPGGGLRRKIQAVLDLQAILDRFGR